MIRIEEKKNKNRARKRRPFLTAVAALPLMSILLSGCGLPFAGGGSGGGLRYSGDKGGESVEMSKIVDFSFGYSSGSYMNSGCTYNAKKTEEGVEVYVRQDGIDMDDVPVIITDDSFLEEIEKILADNHVEAWNGYSLSAQDVMDGDSFSLLAAMDNNQLLRAHGYEAWPEGYGNVQGALDELFVDLYESHYPNKEKALKKYFDQEIMGGKGFSQETQISYPYVRTGENRFEYGDPGLGECVIARAIGNFTSGYYYDSNDPRELAVVRLYPEEAETEGFVKTVMSLEIYRIDDEMKISKTGETVIDEDVTSNEGIYGRFFVHESEEKCCFGYSVLYNNTASTDDNAYLLRLFSFEDGEFEKIADEKIPEPKDRESFSYDDLSAFSQVAEKYGFAVSLNNWKEKPWDPMIDRFDCDKILVDLYTKNNFDKGFDAAFTDAKIGSNVGDYGVSGSFKGATWYE